MFVVRGQSVAAVRGQQSVAVRGQSVASCMDGHRAVRRAQGLALGLRRDQVLTLVVVKQRATWPRARRAGTRPRSGSSIATGEWPRACRAGARPGSGSSKAAGDVASCLSCGPKASPW